MEAFASSTEGTNYFYVCEGQQTLKLVFHAMQKYIY